ncbi:NAD(P)H-hydrate dehydratase [Undibacterium sp. LX40W]|uniref:Bifunctional NAD(P)H-hydrate repair enzyme n=1 Tax=Undibacterium nitidum TaxID=2762298 RepID=A0A923HUH0_9BURK|nr:MULTISPECIES: NAD(P)H-hydrate dehydratase [Undibacterium]MBC3880316.1 NAD(P)H-hydrate dehydratase [Undibacterium nitidum]MBC3890948.1 NAD(P)H-hydrate dehydratase [Undibacterium sp. LX40W]
MKLSPPCNLSVYLSKDIRAIETAVKAHAPKPSLMQRAGLAAANLASQLIHINEPILIFAGPGDNGGDAFEMAIHLSQRGYLVQIYRLNEETQYSHDAALSLGGATNSAITWIVSHEDLEQALQSTSLIVDGLFGIGLNRAIIGRAAELVNLINQTSQRRSIPVLSLDIPSGLNADTGNIFTHTGASANSITTTIRATHTITFIANKPGLFTAKGRDFAGKIILETLNIDADSFPRTSLYLNANDNVTGLLHRRNHDSNKGSFGDVSIIGGADGMCGAAILSARGALMSGAGKVHVGFCTEQTRSSMEIDPQYPEIMCRHANDIEFAKSVIAIGPGLAHSPTAKKLLARALNESPCLVIDADAINLIAQDIQLQHQVLKRREKNFSTILTPHPLEAARLLNTDTANIQRDRLEAISELTDKFQTIVILKGSGSLISDGQTTFINTSGNPALATGGTGDVLTGVCAALLAQGLAPIDAARLACFVHGAAADALVDAGTGPIGLNASELMPAIRRQLNQISRG